MMHMWDCKTMFFEQWRFGIVDRCLNHHLMDQFVAMVCIGRGAWWPQYAAIDSIEKLAELRASVGVQWMLFNQTMGAARRAINMVRTLQKLVGTVERVTELLELLDQLSTAAREENKKNFVDDDCIAFEHVDVHTPAGVPLVK
jgi:hypothetical protein